MSSILIFCVCVCVCVLCVCDCMARQKTERTAKSAALTASVIWEVNVSGTETCRQFLPAPWRRSAENIHTAVKHIVFQPVYMHADKNGERGCSAETRAQAQMENKCSTSSDSKHKYIKQLFRCVFRF